MLKKKTTKKAKPAKKATKARKTQSGGINSNSLQARGIIRREISTFYGPKATGERLPAVMAMKRDAESYAKGSGLSNGRGKSDWGKGAALVDGGSFRCYHSDQANFLKKIYGKKVDKWPGDKIHNTYAGLIGREYSRMLDESKKQKASSSKKGVKR